MTLFVMFKSFNILIFMSAICHKKGFVSAFERTDCRDGNQPYNIFHKRKIFDQFCYEFSRSSGNYESKKDECEVKDGIIVLPRNETENDFIVNELVGGEDPIWLGVTYNAQEDTWIDVCGDPISWNKWVSDLFINECPYMSTKVTSTQTVGYWYRADCNTGSYNVVCMRAFGGQKVKDILCQKTTPTTSSTTITTPPSTTPAATAIQQVQVQKIGCNLDCGEGTCINDNHCNYCDPNQCSEGECVQTQSFTEDNKTRNFSCQCNDRYFGDYCQQLKDDPCRSDSTAICKNGGTCVVAEKPGPNEWLCLFVGGPKLGRAKDCSGEKESPYPIPEKTLLAIISLPISFFFIGFLACCVIECKTAGEVPDLEDLAPISSSTSISSSDSVSALMESAPIPMETWLQQNYLEQEKDTDEKADDRLLVSEEMTNELEVSAHNRENSHDEQHAVSNVEFNGSLNKDENISEYKRRISKKEHRVVSYKKLDDVSGKKEISRRDENKFEDKRKISKYAQHVASKNNLKESSGKIKPTHNDEDKVQKKLERKKKELHVASNYNLDEISIIEEIEERDESKSSLSQKDQASVANSIKSIQPTLTTTSNEGKDE